MLRTTNSSTGRRERLVDDICLTWRQNRRGVLVFLMLCYFLLHLVNMLLFTSAHANAARTVDHVKLGTPSRHHYEAFCHVNT